MNELIVREGDYVHVIRTVHVYGRDVELGTTVHYDRLLSLLGLDFELPAKVQGKTRKPTTEGAKFSRYVGLVDRAIRTGKWSTGHRIDKKEVMEKLLTRFGSLAPEEWDNITVSAIILLKGLRECDKVPVSQRGELWQVVMDLAASI